MGYYPILDHAPNGRNEGNEWQLWIAATTNTKATEAHRSTARSSSLQPERAPKIAAVLGSSQ